MSERERGEWERGRERKRCRKSFLRFAKLHSGHSLTCEEGKVSFGSQLFTPLLLDDDRAAVL